MTMSRSSIEAAFAALASLNASWHVEIGRPSGAGWIQGEELRDAERGPFHDLLVRIGERAKTADRRTIAASFALRFGWASAMAIAPYLRYDCVPDIGLDNVAFKFKESTFFERTAIYHARDVVGAEDPLRTLRHQLAAQAGPVVDALYRWSGFARRGTWGMLTSSWAAQFTGLCDTPDDQRGLLPILESLFQGDDDVAAMQPRIHPVTHGSVTHLYQRRASCCRYYLLPQGDLCASCPLVSHETRLQLNLEWMKTQLERRAKAGGHA
jgi:FhuF 2Fe-2S C-terminal domain